ncbi:phosphoesterase [Undibacterium sp. YM2]|jgi:hypothetical protein|uniref:IcmT/TraK family protein n=1 Tax=unclassified Undibacterium TaxID=2630295 RepID=UPI001331D0B3|nr:MULTISPECIES: IcmT/TraK family protein [unclassified Undibacterium]BBB63363.1 phosphoesterase [Undibacterium sp. KW1]BBB69322.1 phosphoesterase [Undibacterium sp. YM2]
MANNIDDGTAKVIWRDSARELRFLGINYVAVFPLVFWLLHANMFTFVVAVTVIVALTILERFKYSPMVVFRLVRCFIGGKVRYAKNWNEMKRYRS